MRYHTTINGLIPFTEEEELEWDLISAAPPEPVPSEITNWQCKKQLRAIGKYEAVDSAIASMGIDAQIDWQHAAVFKRDYPLILGMQQLLNQTDTDVDEFFIQAAKL